MEHLDVQCVSIQERWLAYDIKTRCNYKNTINILQVAVGRGRARSYPYQRALVLRNHEDHLKDAQSALNSSKVCYYF